MYVCMYVCTYMYVCVCVCVCMHIRCVCMHVCNACMHACMHVCTYVHVFICTYVRLYVCMYAVGLYVMICLDCSYCIIACYRVLCCVWLDWVVVVVVMWGIDLLYSIDCMALCGID